LIYKTALEFSISRHSEILLEKMFAKRKKIVELGIVAATQLNRAAEFSSGTAGVRHAMRI
jgi:hypothetical protein